MKVRVRLFAAAKEAAGSDELTVELPDHAAIADLRAAIIASQPQLQQIVSHSLWAVGTEYVDDSTLLTKDSDIALIPPVSGG
jgi:molybdopterin converting factor subunit 1